MNGRAKMEKSKEEHRDAPAAISAPSSRASRLSLSSRSIPFLLAPTVPRARSCSLVSRCAVCSRRECPKERWKTRQRKPWSMRKKGRKKNSLARSLSPPLSPPPSSSSSFFKKPSLKKWATPSRASTTTGKQQARPRTAFSRRKTTEKPGSGPWSSSNSLGPALCCGRPSRLRRALRRRRRSLRCCRLRGPSPTATSTSPGPRKERAREVLLPAL